MPKADRPTIGAYVCPMDDSERTKLGPPEDEPILPWYEGRFTHAFVALHPFFAVDGLHPSVCESGSLILKRSAKPDGIGLLEWMGEARTDRRTGKEIDSDMLDAIAKEFARPVRWQSICREAGFTSHCDLDCALRTHIGGLRQELANVRLTEKLLLYCDREGIFLPTEGRFEPVMQDALMQMFVRAGCREIVAGDEFGDEDRLVDVEALTGGRPWVGEEDVPAYGARRLFAPDRSLLAWVHWDSFHTVIFGTDDSLAGLRLSELFEGFWCSEATVTYWLTQPPIPLVQ